MPRLTRDRWIEEGLSALRAEGPAALAADRLARRLEVSRGSFYWHFKSAADFAAAVLGEWEQRWTTRIIETVGQSGGDPRARLQALIARTGGSGEDASLYGAAKIMALRDPALATLLRRVDRRRTRFVADLLVAGGVPEAIALLRARIVYAWAMGQMLTTDGEADPAIAAALSDFAFSRPAGMSSPSG